MLGRILLHQLWWAPRQRRRQDRTGLFIVAAGVGLLLVGAVGTFFARLVEAAVSRQREYLADASAVQYTRDPSGIGQALMKIGGFEGENRIRAAHATEAEHLFFTSGFGAALASHPPLKDRIRRLIPGWDGSFIAPDRALATQAAASSPAGNGRSGRQRGDRLARNPPEENP